MASVQCKDLDDISLCAKLQEGKLCAVYNRDGVKKCRKFKNARPLTGEDIVRLKKVPLSSNAFAAKSSNNSLSRVSNSSAVLEEEPKPKIPTTLEKIKRVWSPEESLKIQENIDELEFFPIRAIKGLLQNETIRSALEKEILALPAADKDVYLDRYERMTTDEFLVLLNKLDIDGIELKKNILANIEKGSTSLYEEIENAVLKALESRKNNSSTVYVTSKNVRTSEYIKNTGINSFESILNNFKRFNVFEKTSSSGSIIFNAYFESSKPVNSLRQLNIPNNPFYFKIYPKKVEYTSANVRELENPGLDFEKSAYNKLFQLVQKNVTPNILCKVAGANVSGFNDIFLQSAKLSEPIKTEFTEQAKKILNKKWLETGVIITQPGGKTVHQLFGTLKAEEKRSVLFQLLYTLYVFEKIEFSHGDLHIGNIFILDVPKTEMCYIVEGQQYRFETTKLVKIYDFDHGTFCKTTSIRVNRDESFTIDEELNKTRNIDNTLNTMYAETNIFNKNLDLLIFTNYLSYVYPRFFDHFTISTSDTEVNDFFRECFPGFDSTNPLSQVKIRNTLLMLLQTEENLLEANRIFNLKASRGEEYTKYNVDSKVLDMTWMDYFKGIKRNFGRITKNINGDVPNNHMWIPDTIVLPKNRMLGNRYFDSFKSDVPIDIRKMPVYTIDARL
jgi:hypothetical protein